MAGPMPYDADREKAQRHRAHYERMLKPESGCSEAERAQAKERLEAMGPAPKAEPRPRARGFDPRTEWDPRTADDVLRSAGFAGYTSTSTGGTGTYGAKPPPPDPEVARRDAVARQRLQVEAVPGWWTNERLVLFRSSAYLWSAGEVLEFSTHDKALRASRMVKDDEVPDALHALALYLQANMASEHARRMAKDCMRQLSTGFICKGHVEAIASGMAPC